MVTLLLETSWSHNTPCHRQFQRKPDPSCTLDTEKCYLRPLGFGAWPSLLKPYGKSYDITHQLKKGERVLKSG